VGKKELVRKRDTEVIEMARRGDHKVVCEWKTEALLFMLLNQKAQRRCS